MFLGVRRYEDFQRGLVIARNILQNRLNALVEAGVLERRPYAGRRSEYFLTKKGRDLWPAMMSLLAWGDRYYAPDGLPRIFKHVDCGGRMNEHLHCRKCGERLSDRNVYWVWGRGTSKAMRAKRDALEAKAA